MPSPNEFPSDEMKIDPLHKILILKISQSVINKLESVDKAVSHAWRLDKERTEKADYILAVLDRVCCGVYTACSWHEVDIYQGIRYGFEGDEAPKGIRDLYMDKRLPDDVANAWNPVGYSGSFNRC